tara:strand:- start:459 stop:773 length:315 start_codon:yes stop_codon:yes gene_type:complete
MAHYKVIKPDQKINKDGESIAGCDMSGLPEDFWALTWDGSDGHIEYAGNVKSNLVVSSKSQIKSALGVSLPTLIERRDARIEEIKVEKAEAKAAREAEIEAAKN